MCVCSCIGHIWDDIFVLCHCPDDLILRSELHKPRETQKMCFESRTANHCCTLQFLKHWYFHQALEKFENGKIQLYTAHLTFCTYLALLTGKVVNVNQINVQIIVFLIKQHILCLFSQTLCFNVAHRCNILMEESHQ